MTLKELQIDSSWTLFMDRDGVINLLKVGDYIKKKEEFHFLPKAREAIAKFSQIFDYLFIVTNQQGIGKGVMTEKDLFAIHHYMLDEIEFAGGRITKIYFEPGLAIRENKRRKPDIGMGEEAKKEYPNINFKKSIMVGDSDSDILFGEKLGMRTIKIGKKKGSADFCFESLHDLASAF